MQPYQSAYPLGAKSQVDTQERSGIDRYKSVVEKLQAMLETIKKKLKIARSEYAREMQSKTELEELLNQCVEQVKTENAGKAEGEKGVFVKKKSMGFEKTEFSKEQREKIVEMLLSQERVLALLYDKTFPNKPEEKKAGEEVGAADNGKKEEEDEFEEKEEK